MSRLNKLTLALVAVVVLGFTAPTIKADVCGSVGGNLVANCGFETGTFASWTQTGNTGFTGVFSSPRNSGSFGAEFGPVGSLGGIQQNIVTVPGGLYTMSFFLENDSGGTPNEFRAFVNGVLVSTGTNLAAFSFTQFTFSGLLATGSSTQIQFLFRHDPSFFHFVVVVLQSQHPATAQQIYSLILHH